MEDIKWIFFDIGYTLVDETAVWAQRCREQAQTDEARALGLSAEQIYAEIVQASQNYLPQYRTVVRKFGFSHPAPYRHALEKLYDEAPGVLQTLSEAFCLGVIANQTDGLSERLRAWGIAEYFSLVVSSWDHKIMKPDVRLFTIALEQAGCAPQQAVMVGDRLDNDIEPAKKTGMKTVWCKQGFGALQSPRSAESVPDYQIESLADLPRLFYT
ncbi:MAG: HAD family hydrolase [Oscillospiraceae bacterium]|jgi:HAD superfamily hydrolase (TIGR01509 family)|nr:HAD family hydrolase [Oscillospiraceae bacterium]